MISESTREKLRKAREGKKDPEPTRLKKQASLERSRAILNQMRGEPSEGTPFGAYIRKTRIEKGFTQVALCDAVAISLSYLRVIERGDSAPREPIIIRLAQTLQVDLDELKQLANASRRPRKPFSEETLQKMRLAKRGKKESDETKDKKSLSHMKRKSIATECGFCGIPGPVEEKTAIYYEDEQAGFDLCPTCFAQWQANPDGAVLDSERQEKTA
jgi:transcriptional regulator with XRE-family HTH domain